MDQEQKEFLSALVDKIMDSCNPKPVPEQEKRENLRDYFAAQAMAGMVQQGGFNNSTDGIHDDAFRCYEFADSMLKAKLIA